VELMKGNNKEIWR